MGEYYELAATWDGNVVHSFLDGAEIPAKPPVSAQRVYGEWPSIEFAPYMSEYFDAELSDVWIQRR